LGVVLFTLSEDDLRDDMAIELAAERSWGSGMREWSKE
jgi:hypothetical protein